MSETTQLNDWMEIHSLKVKARIGVHAWEQKIDQTLSFDIRFPIQLEAIVVTLSQTVDYDALCQAVVTFVSTQAFDLIETVAQQVAQLILSEFKVKQVHVAVSKPWAIEQAGNITVRVTR